MLNTKCKFLKEGNQVNILQRKGMPWACTNQSSNDMSKTSEKLIHYNRRWHRWNIEPGERESKQIQRTTIGKLWFSPLKMK